VFVTFEGIEGCGKSVQAKALASYIETTGRATLWTREPGGTALGEQLRSILLHAEGMVVDPVAETLLFSAARAQHVAEVIRPALRARRVVVCDRFADSTIAYQVYGRGLDRHPVESVLHFATGGLTPDLTVLLDLDPADGLRRKAVHGTDRFERLDLEFHNRVRDGYRAMAAADPQRWLVLDGSQSVAELSRIIRERVEAILSMSPASGAKG
jgi:dTMP kinase